MKFGARREPEAVELGAGRRVEPLPALRGGVEQSIREAFLARATTTAWGRVARGAASVAAAARPAARRALGDRERQAVHPPPLVPAGRDPHTHAAHRGVPGPREHVHAHPSGLLVVDEMAAHGASGMGFTDWWRIQQEVIDAIPWNAYVMWDRGVNVGST